MITITTATARKGYEFARLQYMIFLRNAGRTNAQIANAVGVSHATVVNLLGYQPENINKVSFSKRGRKAAATRKRNKVKASIKLIDTSITALKAEKASLEKQLA